MIMQRNTPRSLSWSGVAAVMVVGLFLLPFLPVVGQEPAGSKGQENSKQPDVTDLKIAELKKQLHALEKQKQAEKDKEAIIEKERRDASIGKTRKEVAVLATEVEAKRRELQELEKRHKDALARLAKLEGKSSWSYALTPDGKTYWVESPLVSDGKIFYYDGLSGDAVWTVKPDSDYIYFNNEPAKGKSAVSKVDFLKSQKSGWKAEQAAGGKSADLEKKLDRLAKELEELRHELRQNREKSGK